MEQPDFDKCGGLIPVIAQEAASGEVLMLAYMNRESWLHTLKTGNATYWSRSRNVLWTKGESSGNIQCVRDIFIDCDEDAVLLKVEQMGGAACHTGYSSCFYRKLAGDKVEIIGERRFDPEEVYK